MAPKGHITAAHGDVVEIETCDGLPAINDAVILRRPNASDIVLEVCARRQAEARRCRSRADPQSFASAP
jgi:hypothetical protein